MIRAVVVVVVVVVVKIGVVFLPFENSLQFFEHNLGELLAINVRCGNKEKSCVRAWRGAKAEIPIGGTATLGLLCNP
jgi:hypothetical protein